MRCILQKLTSTATKPSSGEFFLTFFKVFIHFLTLLLSFRLASQSAFVTKFTLDCFFELGLNEELASDLTKTISRSLYILSPVLPLSFILVQLDESEDNKKSSSELNPSEPTSRNIKTDQCTPFSTTDFNSVSGPLLVQTAVHDSSQSNANPNIGVDLRGELQSPTPQMSQ